MNTAFDRSPRLIRFSPATELSTEQRMLYVALRRQSLRSSLRFSFIWGVITGASGMAVLVAAVLWV